LSFHLLTPWLLAAQDESEKLDVFWCLREVRGKNTWILNYFLAKSCLKLNYTLAITSIARQKY